MFFMAGLMKEEVILQANKQNYCTIVFFCFLDCLGLLNMSFCFVVKAVMTLLGKVFLFVYLNSTNLKVRKIIFFW